MWTQRYRRRITCNNGGRDQNYVSTSQGSWITTRRKQEARKDLPREPSERAWPCQHLHFRLLISRTRREYISVVLSHSVCGALLWQVSEPNMPHPPQPHSSFLFLFHSFPPQITSFFLIKYRKRTTVLYFKHLEHFNKHLTLLVCMVLNVHLYNTFKVKIELIYYTYFISQP